LASLPDSVTITNIVKRENCDEFFVTFNPPEHRACPHCESNDCIVKDSRYLQTCGMSPLPSAAPSSPLPQAATVLQELQL
jgi:hypothetical protein